MSLLDEHIAEQIARAQDMLGRLGQRDAYETNYTTEKLGSALQACATALALCGSTPEDIGMLAGKTASMGTVQRGHILQR